MDQRTDKIRRWFELTPCVDWFVFFVFSIPTLTNFLTCSSYQLTSLSSFLLPLPFNLPNQSPIRKKKVRGTAKAKVGAAGKKKK